MYKTELDTTLCRLLETYRVFGIWRNEDESKFRSSCIRVLYFIHYLGLSVYILTGAYYALLNNDIKEATFLFEAQITAFIMTVKLAYLLWRKDEILKFLFDPIMAHGTDDYDELKEVNRKIEAFAILCKVFVGSVCFNVTFLIFLTLPMFTGGEKMLPLFIRFNLKRDYDMVFYWVAYIYGSLGCIVSLFYSCFTLLVWYIMNNYSIEYKLIGQRFRCLGAAKAKAYHQELIHLIRAHNNLFDTVEKFRSCFSALFLAEIFTGAVYICISTYNMSYNTPDNVFEIGVYMTFLLHSFFEIFFNMYLANEITIESDQISYCIFESNWVDQSKSTKRCVLILCEMLKRPQELTVFIYPMNLEKFTTIVNAAYSLFNILKSFK